MGMSAAITIRSYAPRSCPCRRAWIFRFPSSASEWLHNWRGEWPTERPRDRKASSCRRVWFRQTWNIRRNSIHDGRAKWLGKIGLLESGQFFLVSIPRRKFNSAFKRDGGDCAPISEEIECDRIGGRN